MNSLYLNDIDLIALERDYCKRSLHNFVKRAWHIIEPGTPFVDNWHVEAICEHLEAVSRNEINRLLINIPPGAMKSLLVNVLWPAWEWGPAGFAHHRVISASHEASLAVRDTRKMRMIIKDDWFQKLWPLEFTSDQNQKTYFENEKTGFRQASAVGGMTGKRGHRVIWDDPLSAKNANSEAHRYEANTIMDETLPTRLVNPQHSAIIIVMQRLHEDDPSGHLLAGDYGYEHLCMPMEFERERRCVTSIGWRDPRTEENELLFPARFPRDVVDRDKKAMGSYAAAGQFQQRPAPRSGGFFAWENLEIVDAPPAQFDRLVRFWDKAGTEDGGARTAGVLIGSCAGMWYILDVITEQYSAAKRERLIKTTADLDGTSVIVGIEQEPGSGGKESAEFTVRNLAGYTVKVDKVSGDKETRAEPYSVQVEAGNVKIVKGAWNKLFVDEHKTFPRGKYKDQIDATAGGFNMIAGAKTSRPRLRQV